MQLAPTTEDAYDLLHQGTLALADISENGICVNEELLQKNIAKVGRMIRHQEQLLKSDDVWKEWTKTYGGKANLTSRPQLATILTKQFPEAWTEEDKTEKGAPKTDEETLSKIDIPFVSDYLKLQKLAKVRSTYLIGIQRETVDGLLHPVFNLGIARTYRSSSDSPNFQNMPIRVPWISELIRSCLIARPGHFLVETDFKGLEVSIAACYNKDPRLIDYVSDPSLDMHRDMAAEIFRCGIDQVTKESRYCAKNMFVFPQFYGDWYVSCTKNLWDAIRKMNLGLKDGTPMVEHLLAQGIRKRGACEPKQDPVPGSFEQHLKEVERAFWNDRFSVYTQWKKDWYGKYLKQGYFQMLTGFVCRGYMDRKEVINYAIQGAAFHCLLMCLIKLNAYLKRHNMKTKIVGQIHDSILADVHESEMETYLRVAKRILTEVLPQMWPWIIVPLIVEIEASPLGGSWFEKAKIEA